MVMRLGYRSSQYGIRWSVFWFALSSCVLILGCGANSVSNSQKDSRSNLGLAVNVTTLTFPDTAVGAISPAQAITITNTSTANVMIGAVNVEGPYRVIGATCVLVLAPKSSCPMTVSLVPQQPGSASGSMTIVSNASSPSVS